MTSFEFSPVQNLRTTTTSSLSTCLKLSPSFERLGVGKLKNRRLLSRFCCSSHDNREDTTFYTVLGLKKSVELHEVKSAYRILVRKYHPDVCREGGMSEAECTKKFIEIQLAYETLSDPQKRALYDIELSQLFLRKSWSKENKPWQKKSWFWNKSYKHTNQEEVSVFVHVI